ncbi:MAG: autotransporter assembly complex protein TamA [Thiotrichales bacterium]
MKQTHFGIRFFTLWIILPGLLVTGSAALAMEEAASGKTTTEQKVQPKVRVELIGLEKNLKKNVEAFLEIYQAQQDPVTSVAQLRYLHRAAPPQIEKALQPFAYFKPQVRSELTHEDNQWLARYTINPGEQIPLTRADILLTGEGKDDPAFAEALKAYPLAVGQALDQAQYEQLKKRFQVLAAERGYFDARLISNKINIDLKAYQASIDLAFETGPRYKLGEVSFHEEKPWLATEFLNKFNGVVPGQDYHAQALQTLQADLANSEYYSEVEIQASPDQAKNRVIPVTVNLRPKLPRRYSFGIGYGTDTGARVKAGIVGRRVNRYGHHYQAEAVVSQISYGAAGEYVIPAKDPRSDAYGLRASYLDEHSDVRNYESFNIGGYYRFRKGLWMRTYALDYRIERYKLENETPTSTLLIPSLEWTRTYPAELEKRIYTVNGAWLQWRLRGGHESLLSDTSFIQPQVAAKWIHSFGNKSRVIGKASAGTTWVSDFKALPTSLRYFTGGDTTVRGYKYNVIGPLDGPLDEKTEGGKHLLEGSFEYEYPLSGSWSLAPFVDVGDAFMDSPDFKTGIGLGLRWKSPIGPVRLDFGHALNQPLGNKLLLHLSIGPDL